MSWFFNADDWFGRHPHACLWMIAVLAMLAGVL